MNANNILSKNAKLPKQLSEADLCTLSSDILAQAKKLGATAAEVDACCGGGFSVTVRKNAVESIDHSNGKTLGIIVYFGHRTGSAITADLSPEAVRLTLEKACHIATFTSEDPYVGLADPELMAYGYPDLDLYHPWSIDVDAAIELAKQCESAGLSANNKITNSEGSSVNTSEVFSVYANSHGFVGNVKTTNHSFGLALIAEKGEEMQREYYYTAARDANDLESFATVANEAAVRTAQRLDARRITTRKCPIIFHADLARSLIGTLVGAISGSNLYRKASFLLDHLHKPVIASHVSIDEHPHIPKAFGSAPFDSEGVKLTPNKLVVDGILQRYVLDTYSGKKLGMETTGNAGGTYNLFVKTSDQDLDALMRTMQTGLLVTEIMGDGVNIITGDYSRGVFGYWVENGVIQYPVTGATIAGNLKDMLLNIVAIGNDIDHRGSILTGSILVDNMVVAGS